jgi:hypothetical protein
MPHRFRFAYDAKASEFRIPEISQRGLRTLLAPVGLGCPPPMVYPLVGAEVVSEEFLGWCDM